MCIELGNGTAIFKYSLLLPFFQRVLCGKQRDVFDGSDTDEELKDANLRKSSFLFCFTSIQNVTALLLILILCFCLNFQRIPLKFGMVQMRKV